MDVLRTVSLLSDVGCSSLYMNLPVIRSVSLKFLWRRDAYTLAPGRRQAGTREGTRVGEAIVGIGVRGLSLSTLGD